MSHEIRSGIPLIISHALVEITKSVITDNKLLELELNWG